MFERFTDRARRVLVLAQEEARLLGHDFIGTEHILLGLVREGEGVAAKALGSLGISPEAVRDKVEEAIGPAGTSPVGSAPLTLRAKKVLELSLREALQLGHDFIGTEHILLGLLREGEGTGAEVLVGLGADLSRVRQRVIEVLSGYYQGEACNWPAEAEPPPSAHAPLLPRRWRASKARRLSGATTRPVLGAPPRALRSWGDPAWGDPAWVDPAWGDPDLVAYGVVGLGQRWGSRSGIGSVAGRRGARMVVTSQGLSFEGPGGASVRVTSHRLGDGDHFARVRAWALADPYPASPAGWAARDQASGEGRPPLPGPREADWTPATIPVDGQNTSFEVCDLGDGRWAAAGELPGAIVTIASQGVPLASVALERLAGTDPPAPAPPDIGAHTEAVLGALEDRFARVPFARVRRWADYWALRDVEADHLRRLAQREGLSDQDHQALEAYWLGRIDAALAQTVGRLRLADTESLHPCRLARRIRPELAFQLWFNTVGPGARTWFSNRYTTLRRRTFRIRWRP